MTREKQYEVLYRHFKDCERFWEHELKTDSDLDREPYIHAIMEIPVVDPFHMKGEPFDKDLRENFIKSRFMDCYGRDWERCYKEMRSGIRDVN